MTIRYSDHQVLRDINYGGDSLLLTGRKTSMFTLKQRFTTIYIGFWGKKTCFFLKSNANLTTYDVIKQTRTEAGRMT